MSGPSRSAKCWSISLPTPPGSGFHGPAHRSPRRLVRSTDGRDRSSLTRRGPNATRSSPPPTTNSPCGKLPVDLSKSQSGHSLPLVQLNRPYESPVTNISYRLTVVRLGLSKLGPGEPRIRPAKLVADNLGIHWRARIRGAAYPVTAMQSISRAALSARSTPPTVMRAGGASPNTSR